MDFYRILRLVTKIKSPRIKILGLLTMHMLKRRYIGIFLDPVMACNLRCRMCYLSAPGYKIKAKPDKIKMDGATLDYIAETFFPYAMKLQIGCSTEPTLYSGLDTIVRLAKEKGVPYISLTTNGQLLDEEKLRMLAEEGLNEVTVSVHGFDRKTYEEMMTGADFEKFLRLISSLKMVKEDKPELKVRLNYVINADNIQSLRKMYDVLDGLRPDVLQLRPIQKLGESSYSNFSHEEIKAAYDEVLGPILDRCKEEGTVCLCPSKRNLEAYAEEYDPMADYLEELTYYYISPSGVNKPEFQWMQDSFSSYHGRRGTARKIWDTFLRWDHKAAQYHSSRKLNYNVN